MKSRHEHVNSFEVAVVGMIAIGFILIGIILFSSLIPRVQINVASATKMFDIHDQVSDTVSGLVDNVEFVLSVSNQFDNQFYIAFTQIATLPPETFNVPTQIATDAARNIEVAINNLSDQVAGGYSQQIQTRAAFAQSTQQSLELAYQAPAGEVLGASIDLSSSQPVAAYDKIAGKVSADQSIKMPYGYDPPNLGQIKLSLINLIKQ